ncbi:WD repeat-containing protein 97 isoform X2 [Xenopus tropicalis]|uniref:WD repeat-containing protein 97 isoform X2 n=1 Tax=Xenopus tropicalis TaxID=8364 RepID=A0A8J1JQ07_XENTR|nr:WD repeat-containing protein 97 isoform X2 [Xenopus tropicalis]
MESTPITDIKGSPRLQTWQGMETRAEKNRKGRALYLWARLRDGVRSTVYKMRRADPQPQTIGHGLQLVCHLPFRRALRGITWVSQQNLLLSLDSDGLIRQHHTDGRVQACAQASLPLCGLLYAWHSQKLVAWAHQELRVLDTTLTPLTVCRVARGVFCCVYNPGRDQLLTGGTGGVQLWAFSEGSWHLTCKQVLKEGLKETDRVNIIALDTAAPLAHTCFAVCGAGVWEYDLGHGELRRVWNNLHLRPITGLIYSQSRQTLITASREGTIKLWGKSAELKGVCVAHTGPVTALSFSSSGRYFLSGSEDRTVRTWDLETQEQVGEQVLAQPVLGLETFRADGKFLVSRSEFCLDLWQIQNLYQYHTPLGASVTDMKVSGGQFVPRVACLCSDSAVRLVATGTGQLLSSLALDGPLAIEFCPHTESVYVLLKNGDLLRASSVGSPMGVRNTLRVGSSQAPPLCLSLYCAIADQQSADWIEMGRERERQFTSDGGKNRFLPVIGLDDGTISVCDWYPSRVLCQLKAHSPARVTSLMSSPENSFVLSAGSDWTIRIWRMFPHSEGGLSPHMSFLCSRPIERMCMIGSQLFVSFHNQSSGSSSLVQYCLHSATRRDHSPAQDHQQQITGLCSCPTLGLVASSGKDKKIHIWNEHNQLLRVLSLDCAPESLAFSSQSAALLLGIKGHVCSIDFTELLPVTYQLKTMSVEPPSLVTEPPVPVQGSVSQSLSENDRNRFLRPPPLPSRSAVPPCTINKDPTERDRIREEYEARAALLYRDQELLLLLKGKVKPNRKILPSSGTEAMKRYLLRLYGERPNIQNIPCSGAVPNSAVLQLLPQSKPDEQRELEETARERIMPLSESETKLRVPVREHWKELGEECETSEEVNDLEEEERILQRISQAETLGSCKTDPETIQLPLRPLPPLTGRESLRRRAQMPFASRIPQRQPKSHSPESTVEAAVSPEIPSLPLPTFPSEPEQLERHQIPSPDEPALNGSSEEQRVAAQPVPPFMLQYIQETWFTDIFPEAKEELHHVCEAEFVSRLLHGLAHVGHPMRSDILIAVKTLLLKGQPKNLKEIHSSLIQAMNPTQGLNLEVPEDRDFVFSCLHILTDLSCATNELVVELIVIFVQVPPSYWGQMPVFFKKIGVHDSQGFLDKEFSSWATWELSDRRRTDVRDMCEQWLLYWAQHLKEIGKMGTNKGADSTITVTFVEVLNYFCKVQMKKELGAMKEESVPNRSTILALPPIRRERALLRLAERGGSLRHREAQDCHPAPVCPPLLPEIIPFINLPLKKLTLNPLTPVLGVPSPLPLSGSHRYFVWQRSFGSSYC